jgi:hypothetical protein
MDPHRSILALEQTTELTLCIFSFVLHLHLSLSRSRHSVHKQHGAVPRNPGRRRHRNPGRPNSHFSCAAHLFIILHMAFQPVMQHLAKFFNVLTPRTSVTFLKWKMREFCFQSLFVNATLMQRCNCIELKF